eukprot:1702911-Amphidinium_carterae.1
MAFPSSSGRYRVFRSQTLAFEAARLFIACLYSMMFWAPSALSKACSNEHRLRAAPVGFKPSPSRLLFFGRSARPFDRVFWKQSLVDL